MNTFRNIFATVAMFLFVGLAFAFSPAMATTALVCTTGAESFASVSDVQGNEIFDELLLPPLNELNKLEEAARMNAPDN